MDNGDEDDSYVEWQQFDYTKHVLKGYLARLQKQYIELQSYVITGREESLIAVTAGRIDEIKGFVKILSGGKVQ